MKHQFKAWALKDKEGRIYWVNEDRDWFLKKLGWILKEMIERGLVTVEEVPDGD